jgi:hypothetical protein
MASVRVNWPATAGPAQAEMMGHVPQPGPAVPAIAGPVKGLRRMLARRAYSGTLVTTEASVRRGQRDPILVFRRTWAYPMTQEGQCQPRCYAPSEGSEHTGTSNG